MSSTNEEIIRDALNLLGILEETETVSAEQGAHGLRSLNDMMAEWELDGIDYNYNRQTDITSTFPSEDVECVKYNLAVRLASHYQAVIPPGVAAVAMAGYKRKERDAVKENAVEQDVSDMPLGTGHWQYKSINNA